MERPQPVIEAANANTIKAWGDFTFSTKVSAAGRIGNGLWTLGDTTVISKVVLPIRAAYACPQHFRAARQ
jgi:hypothetical protein